MDRTRTGADFTALGVALGCAGAGAGSQAEIIYSQFRALEAAMSTVDFTNLANIDQGG